MKALYKITTAYALAFVLALTCGFTGFELALMTAFGAHATVHAVLGADALLT